MDVWKRVDLEIGTYRDNSSQALQRGGDMKRRGRRNYHLINWKLFLGQGVWRLVKYIIYIQDNN
jgi:hypothetical protein